MALKRQPFLIVTSVPHYMKKRYWLLLLFLAACAPVPQIIPEPTPVVEVPVIREPAPVRILHGNIGDYVIGKAIQPFSLLSTDAIYDNFAIIPVERYDARYQSDSITVLVHVFKFSTREELDVVLNSEFYHIINRGSSYHKGHTVALYLTQDNHRAVIWSSGTELVFVETFADYAAQEIVGAYLAEYPSDLEITQCIDSDGDEHFMKGSATRVLIGSTFVEWTDTCLRDFALYRNKQYVSRKGITEEDGLLEGRCEKDSRRPGFIFEYACPRGCADGACKSA